MNLSVFDAAREEPERVALVIGKAPVTFEELARRVRARASWLVARGCPIPGAGLVALVGSSDRGTLEAVYALMALGQPMALLHPRLTEPERQAVARLLGPRLSLESTDLEATPSPADATPAANPGDDRRCLAVLMTSGTTGHAKGVVLSRAAFLASARASERNLGFRSDDRWLLGLPIAHVGGLSILTRCLIARRTVVVPDEVASGRRLDARALMRVIDEERVTLASLVPTQLEWLLSEEPAWKPPSHLRAVLLGGAAARPSLLERAADRGVPVLTTYGLTEACSQVTTQAAGTVNRGQLGSGVAMPGVEVRIVGGAIEVRGPTLFDRYVPTSGAPPLTSDGWFTTNDLGHLDAAGFLHVLGRRSDVIITGGENVHPVEVETVVEQCPGVAVACAFGVPDDAWGELVAIAIVPSPSGAPSDAGLAAFVQSRLSSHRRPRRIAHLPALEVTPAGKLDRAATRAAALPQLRVL